MPGLNLRQHPHECRTRSVAIPRVKMLFFIFLDLFDLAEQMAADFAV